MVRRLEAREPSQSECGTVDPVLPALKTFNRPCKTGLWTDSHWKDPKILTISLNDPREGWWETSGG